MIDDASLDSGYVLLAGEYTINEFYVPPGWQLSIIDIQDRSGGSYLDTSTTHVDLAGGETVTVTYTYTRMGVAEITQGVKVNLLELIAEPNPDQSPATPPFIISEGDVVGSVVLNTTASGQLLVNVNMDTEPNLVDYDVIVRVFCRNPMNPSPPPPGVCPTYGTKMFRIGKN